MIAGRSFGRLGLLAAALSALLWAAGAASAAEPAPAAAGQVIYPRGSASLDASANQPSVGWGRAVGVVGFVCAAVGGWLYWRGRRESPFNGVRAERKLAVAETRSLGNRQYLVVASYDGRKFLLGVCPGRIDLLAPLDEVPPTKTS